MTDDSTFLSAAAVVALLGPVLAVVAALLSSSSAFRGSIVTSAAVGLVFAVRNLQTLRGTASPRLAPAAITTVFGLWFVAAPLLYEPGFVATALMQLAGLLTASFAGYGTLAALER